MKRSMELAQARVDGYHGDRAAFTRHLVERRQAGYGAMMAAYQGGQAARQAGVACSCPGCRTAAQSSTESETKG